MSIFEFPETGDSRRDFLKKATATAVWLAGSNFLIPAYANTLGENKIDSQENLPWYRRLTRWGQTNVTEVDPMGYDVDWWRGHWNRTQTQGVVINAGGIVSYYPSQVPFHRPAEFLNGRDLFGELSRAAHEDGMAVFARLDSNLAHEEFYQAHPDWFAIDGDGNPYKSGEFYVACVNGPYYERHMPAIIREIVERYQPEGFTDNRWHGLSRDNICYCENCQVKFRKETGNDIPARKDWDNQAYREWIDWSYKRRLDIWELNNRTTKQAGGEHCIWSGMVSASVSEMSDSFRDVKALCDRADILMLDYQSRRDGDGIQYNAEIGKRFNNLLGKDKLALESMAMYLNQGWNPVFRLASQPTLEARMWVISGMAGGIQPWWHHVAAYHEDRRMYKTIEPLYKWHKLNEKFLLNRLPVANVGVVWSQLNTDFYGRDDVAEKVELPWKGVTQALVQAKIPYLPIHIDNIEREADNLSLLILPNIGAMTDLQIEGIRKFVQGGGHLIATGESSLFDQWGNPRTDYALGDLFGAHIAEEPRTENTRWGEQSSWKRDYHTYLRLVPEVRKELDGPVNGTELEVGRKERHRVFAGFEETDILPFGGFLYPITTDTNTEVLATYIPHFPVYPPETSWMREPKTDIPGILVNTKPWGSRVAFLPADIDRQFGRYNLPDHCNLLTNIVRWAINDDLLLDVTGNGLIDCHLYRKSNALILHIVNITSSVGRQPIHELMPTGQLTVKVKLPKGMELNKRLEMQLLVSKSSPATLSYVGNWVQFKIDSILDHELIVIS